MFIKKDTRKVEDILTDPEDSRTHLKLARRSAEFKRSVAVVCSPEAVAQLGRLRYMSLYGNELKSLRGIGALAETPLEELNLGRNMLKKLPTEFEKLVGLKRLWLDDNHLDHWPRPLGALSELRELRLSHNQIGELPDDVPRKLNKLEVLAIDSNRLSVLPSTIGEATRLRELVAAGNTLTSLPEGIGRCRDLRVLWVSSNHVEHLPASIADCASLRALRLNRNRLERLPASLGTLGELKIVNVAHNKLRYLPSTLLHAWRSVLPASVGQEGTPGDGRSALGTQDSMLGEGGEAGDSGMRYRTPADGTWVAAQEDLVVTLDGNPVMTDPGAMLTESQWTQPMVKQWKKK
jgi:hypothetical protein